MLFETQQFDTRLQKPATWSDHFFRHCEFSEISTEGGDVDSVFIGCKIVECHFIDCTFTRDNLNANCSFVDNSWYGCTQSNCLGLEHAFRSNR